MAVLYDLANLTPNSGILFVLFIYVKRCVCLQNPSRLGCWLALLAGVLLFWSTSIYPFGHPLDIY